MVLYATIPKQEMVRTKFLIDILSLKANIVVLFSCSFAKHLNIAHIKKSICFQNRI